MKSIAVTVAAGGSVAVHCFNEIWDKGVRDSL